MSLSSDVHAEAESAYEWSQGPDCVDCSRETFAREQPARVVSISASNSLTFLSPLQRHEMIFSRIGADITRNTSAASSNTSSDSTPEGAAEAGDRLAMNAVLRV